MRIADCDFLDEAHEAVLVDSRLLGTHIMLPEKILPPLLTLLPQIPLLQVVDEGDVVVLSRVN